VFRFSDITHVLFIICFAHAFSHVLHTCNFSAVIHFHIPHTWTVSDITNNPFFINNNRMHCLKFYVQAGYRQSQVFPFPDTAHVLLLILYRARVCFVTYLAWRVRSFHTCSVSRCHACVQFAVCYKKCLNILIPSFMGT
jgi:hypothetical protein